MLHIHLCHVCQLIVYTSPIYGLGCQHEQSGIRSCNKAPITFKFHPYIAAGLLAHRLRLAARATRHHGGRWRWRWHVLFAAHAAAAKKRRSILHFSALFRTFRSLIPLPYYSSPFVL